MPSMSGSLMSSNAMSKVFSWDFWMASFPVPAKWTRSFVFKYGFHSFSYGFVIVDNEYSGVFIQLFSPPILVQSVKLRKSGSIASN